jgi:hypothetical protein
MTPDELANLPEEEREKFRDALALQSNAELERYFEGKLPQITAALTKAASEQDESGLKRIAAGVGAFEAKLSEWNDACGQRASGKLLAVVESLGQTRADIAAALRGDLPGQAGEGDEWKNPSDSQN